MVVPAQVDARAAEAIGDVLTQLPHGLDRLMPGDLLTIERKQGLLKMAHENTGHASVILMVSFLRDMDVDWTGLSSDCRLYTTKCHVCNLFNPSN